MSKEDITDIKRKAQALQAEYELKGTALQEDQRARAGAERNKLLKIVLETVEVVAKREGINMVVDLGAVAYVDDDKDLSDLVIQELSK